MLDQTFIHAPGVGAATERKLWQSGFRSWDSCLGAPETIPLGPVSRDSLIRTVSDSVAALANQDSRFFARHLPLREQWRAARSFHKIGYLDIETDGTDRITVIGLYDGIRVRQYVRGDNLDVFPEEIGQFDYLVTYFGSGFDIPVIRRNFRNLPMDVLHCDLCFALRKLGFKGGLKSVERDAGIHRSETTTGLDGWDAVRLWREYLSGSEDSLAILLAYNADDIVNLEPLLDLAYEGLKTRTLGEISPAPG